MSNDSGIIGGREGQVRGGSRVRGDQLTPDELANLELIAYVDGSQVRLSVDEVGCRADVDSARIGAFL